MSPSSQTILVVDDDPAVSRVLGALLRQEGFDVHVARSGDEALAMLAERSIDVVIDVVIADLRMPGMDGMALLERIGTEWPGVPVVMLTAHGTVPLAVEAMKRGAADFVQKPFDREELLFVIRKSLSRHNRSEAPPSKPAAATLVAASPAMRDCAALCARAATSTATVLLRGESGTGKEVAARAIHEASARRAGPLVKVHCAALPDNLLESELFGYEKGAFTGATRQKPGRVELAQGGTLFLDEIGDITPAMQVKLLRLLQERAYERLGGVRTLTADVRFIAATHRDLEAMVANNTFREDLFYRLNVVPIWIPPLSERSEDIEPLARRFCLEAATANGRSGMTLDQSALAILCKQPWPGNVRQLQNFVERLIVLSDGPVVGAPDVERELARAPLSRSAVENAEVNDMLDKRVREVEREALITALQKAGGNRTVAARLLGVSRRTLYNKMQELGVR